MSPTPTKKDPSLAARAVGDARDAQAIASALRHDRRWWVCGLAAPPHLALFDGPARYRWPSERDAHVTGALIFGDRGLVGVALHAGWSGDHDRTRIAEVVLLDARHDAGAITRAAVAAIIADGATAVRLNAEGPAAASFAHESRPRLVAGDVTWVHIAKGKDLTVDPAETPVTDEELAALGAFGRGGWAGNEEAPAAPIAAEVHDPSVAHTQLLTSSRLLRPLFYRGEPAAQDADVLIVGAGIAGLTAAYALRPRACVVIERETRLGGTARVHVGPLGRMGVGAHYEHDPDPRFSPEILALYEELGIAKRDAMGRWGFVDTQHYIDGQRHEQSVRPDGTVRTNTWRLFEASDEGMRLAAAMLRYEGRVTVPSRLADPEMRELERISFGEWMRRNQCAPSGELAAGVDIILRSDYAVGTERTSAYAALHYFLCRPYLTGGSRTWAPPEGLTYVIDRLIERTPNATIRAGHMVRSIEARADGVIVRALDLAEKRTYEIHARAVVFAAPKRQLKYVHRIDAALFAPTRYASWITVNCLHDFQGERDLLYWTNHTYDPRPEHIGFTWVNHAAPEGPVLLGHYVAYENEMRALFASPRALVRDSIAHTSALIGTDAGRTLRHVRIEKFGHAMPMPMPGTLFLDPNARRANERVVYAGVDTGRLPILAEAFDSGLEAAKLLTKVR